MIFFPVPMALKKKLNPSQNIPKKKLPTKNKKNNSLITTISNELEKFHLSCVPEYTMFLKNYNILFYGYGEKKILLEKMFPKANFINEMPCNFSKTKINIILNGNINENSFFPKNKTILLLDTMEPSKIKFTDLDLQNFNFILKDLTTFENYTKNKLSNFEKNLNNLIMNVSTRSRSLFKILVQNCKNNQIGMNDLLFLAKKELLINNKKIIKNLLLEFVDHKILKLESEIWKLKGKKDEILEIFENGL